MRHVNIQKRAGQSSKLAVSKVCVTKHGSLSFTTLSKCNVLVAHLQSICRHLCCHTLNGEDHSPLTTHHNTQCSVCHAEALHHALQQQTSLAQSGCTLEVKANPQANLPNLAKPSVPGFSHSLAAGTPDVHQEAPAGLHHTALVGPNQTALAGPKSPLLVMSCRGAELAVVSVQLKTGYLRISCGRGLAQDKETLQLLNQVRGLLSKTLQVSRFCGWAVQRECLCTIGSNATVCAAVYASVACDSK